VYIHEYEGSTRKMTSLSQWGIKVDLEGIKVVDVNGQVLAQRESLQHLYMSRGDVLRSIWEIKFWRNVEETSLHHISKTQLDYFNTQREPKTVCFVLNRRRFIVNVW